MNITQIRYVLAVAAYGSFSEAAEHLYIAQPTLSQQIHRLEEELGTKLFNRTTRSLSLTDAGMEFVSQGAKIIHDYDELVLSMKKYGSELIGTLRIGLIWSFTYMHVDQMISAFRRQYPSIRPEFVIDGTDNLEKLLQSNAIDAAVLNSSDDDRFESPIVLSISPICAVVSRQNALSQKTAFEPEDAEGQNLILPGRNSYVCHAVTDFLGTKLQKASVIGYSSQVDTCLQTSAQNLSISFLSKDVVDYYPDIPVKALPLSPGTNRRTIAAFSRSLKENPLLQAFHDFMKTWLSQNCLHLEAQ